MTTRIALKWGALLGVAVCVWTIVVHFLGWYTTDLAKGQIADQVAVVLPVVALFFAIREHGQRLGRAPRVTESLVTGVLTGLVSVPIAAGFLWVYHRFINPRWLDLLVAHERERLAREGAAPEQVAQRVERLIASGTDSGQIIGALVGTVIMSVVISLIVWAVLRVTARRAPA